MAYDEDLARRVRGYLARRLGVAEKKMFGGLAFLLNGNLLVGVRKDTLLVRLDPGGKEVAGPHVSPFEMTGRGRIKGWFLVDLDGLDDDNQLAGWIERATDFVGLLPAK